MSHVKAAGTSRNIHDSPGQRLGVKRFGGQLVHAGEVLVRQVGRTKLAGKGTFISRDFTIHAAIDGVIGFKKVKTKRFTGKTAPRTQVVVEPQQTVKTAKKDAA
ncbi:MAG TPA: 50S ribosomal protein L27 [Candidatus Saccharimonas sp.]|nr:50S ribosomal protein L27 [Candidatus Saccharimonas sp.]